jgi:PAS domain S-box-containing protein
MTGEHSTDLPIPAMISSVSRPSFSAGGVFSASLDAVIVMDAQGLVRDWNQAAQETFGYSHDEALGREVAELIIPGQLRHAHRNALRRHVETGDVRVLDRRLQLSALRKDGSEFPVELNVTRLSGSGEPMFAAFLRELVDHDLTRGENVRLQKRMAFLAQVGLLLDSSLDYDETLRTLADMTVPELAQLTIIDLIDIDGSVQPAVAAALDAEDARALEAIRGAYPLARDGAHPVAAVIRSGKSVLLPAMQPPFLEDIAESETHLELMRRLQYKSAIVVPLIARQRVLGALSLLRMRDASPYGQDDLIVAEELARRAALAVDNARLFASTHELARTLQRSLLPQVLPDIPGLKIATRYRAALEGQEVGGDFYDVFNIGPERWGVVIGDVCGKGAQAAALTALGRYTLRALAEPDAPELLRQLNEVVIRNHEIPAHRFLTLLFASLRVEPDRLELQLAAGGHPPPLLLRHDGSVEPVAVKGPLIGIDSDVEFEPQYVSMVPGDSMLLYTDGLTDARAPAVQISDEELADLVGQGHGMGGAQLAEFLESAATAGEAPRDDIAIVVLEFAGN